MLRRLRRHKADAPQSSETIDGQAAHWYERATSPDFTDAEGEAFRSWYDASQAHRQAYDDLRRAMDRLDAHAAEISAANTKSRRVRRQFSAIAAAAAVVLVAGAAYWETGFSSPEAIAYKSGVGERRIVKLDDGSTMTLNTGSEARVSMSDNARRIDLVRGQGLFDVAPDPDRPFQVHTSNGVIIAVGTAFDVRQHVDGVSDFTLLEGRAVVSGKEADRGRRLWSGGTAPEETVMLEPGQKVSADRRGALTPVAEVDLSHSRLWADGLIVLRSASLKTALAEINRYAPLRQRLALDNDPALDALRISGTFRTDDVAAFAQNLELLLPVTVARENGKAVIAYRPDSDE